jgi:hypothetical protein
MAAAAATPLLPVIIPALISAVGDEEVEVVTLVTGAARCLGAFTPPAAWLPLLLDALGDSFKSALARKANALVISSCLIRAAADAGQVANQQQQLLEALVGVLVGEEVRGADHPGVQAQLLCVVQNLLAWLGPGAAVHGEQLYLLLLQLHGNLSSSGSSSSSQQLQAALGQLADACGVSCSGELAAKYAQPLLPVLTGDSSSWTASSPNFLAFQALLRTTGGPTLAQLLPEVLPVLSACCSSEEVDPALRLGLLRLVDDLLEQEGQGGALLGEGAGQLLVQVLMPALVWRAGKVREGVEAHTGSGACRVSCYLLGAGLGLGLADCLQHRTVLTYDLSPWECAIRVMD